MDTLNELYKEHVNIDTNNIESFHKYIETHLKKPIGSKTEIYNSQWLQDKRFNYIFIGPIRQNIIYSLKDLYVIYKPILEDLYKELSKILVERSEDSEYSIELIYWIEYPENFQDYIKKNKFIQFLLNHIYHFSTYYSLIKLLKIDYNKIENYFSGILINHDNILIGKLISSSLNEEELIKNFMKNIELIFTNKDNIINDDEKLLLVKNVSEKFINELKNNYSELEKISIYSQINYDVFLLSGSFSNIERFKNIVYNWEIPENQELLPFRDRIPDIKISDTDLSLINTQTRILLPAYLLEKTIIPIIIEKDDNNINRMDWNKCFFNLNKRSVNIIDITSVQIDEYISEITNNIFGTVSKLFGFNIKTSTELYKTIYSRDYLFIKDLASLNYNYDWKYRYSARLINEHKQLKIFNTFTDFFKVPPIIVGGLLQYVSTIDCISNCYCNGYLAEISTIEFNDAYSLRTKINKILKNIPSGEAILVNISTLLEWEWKIELIQQIKKEGGPIGGIVISGNFLEKDKLIELIEEISRLTINVIGLNPSNIFELEIVLEILDYFPKIQFLIYWNNCYFGNKRSLEDRYIAILKKYKQIRDHRNVFLINSIDHIQLEDIIHLLTGEWSIKYGVYQMPFDAISINYNLLGIKESSMPIDFKKKISKKKYIKTEEEWETIFNDKSELIDVVNLLGKPVQVLATKASKLWKELERDYFKYSISVRKKKIIKSRKTIIEKLEKNYYKKYIGDLMTMNYYDLLKQTSNLLTENNSSDWIHLHYEWKMKELIKWVIGKHEINLGIGFDQDPFNIIKYIEDNKECAWTQPIFGNLLQTIDIDFFLKLCVKEKLKPVNFIPIIDENLEYWLKLDCLWFPENINSITDYNLEYTIIPFNPYGVFDINGIEYGITNINCYLNKLNNYLKESLKESMKETEEIYNATMVPSDSSLNIISEKLIVPENILSYIEQYKDNIHISLQQFLYISNIYKSCNESVSNYIPDLLKLEQCYIKIKNTEITFLNKNKEVILHIKYYEDSYKIKLEIPIIYNSKLNTIFSIYYNYKNYCWMYPIQEDKDKLIQCNKLMTWILTNMVDKKHKLLTIKNEDLIEFEKCTKIPNKQNLFILYLISKTITRVYLWLYETYNINFLGAICLTHSVDVIKSIEYTDKFKKIEIEPIIRNTEISKKNTIIVINVDLSINNSLICKIILKIQIMYPIVLQYKPVYEYYFRLDITKPEIVLFFKEYPGIKINNNINLEDYTLIDISLVYNENGYNGIISYAEIELGKIDCFEKRYVELLKKYSKQLDTPVYLEKIVPITKKEFYLNPEYDRFLNIISDYNPIYYNSKIASFFGFQQKAINGLWLISNTLRLLEGNIKSYTADFTNLYFNENQVTLNMSRIGNKLGANVNLVEINTIKHRLMNCEISIKSDPTIYLFSDNELIKGLGKTIYYKSKIFKYIYDYADSYMQEKYGIHLLYILNENPSIFNIKLDTEEKKQLYFNTKLILNMEMNYYKFYNENGILNLPLFSHLLIAIYQKALYMEKEYQCSSHNNFSYSGHGLGELVSLLICSNNISIKKLIDIMFIMGCKLSNYAGNSIEEDSNINLYRYVSINPTQLHITGFELEKYIQLINKQQNLKLEISIYDIIENRYIIAGKLIDLIILKECLENKEIKNQINKKKLKDLYKRLEKKKMHELENDYPINLFIKNKLPLHTSIFTSNIKNVCEDLYLLFEDITFCVSNIVNRFISCLSGSYFELSINYLDILIRITGDLSLTKLRDSWDDTEDQIKIKKMLSIILGYQLCIPLNWIKLQEYIMLRNLKQSFEFGAKNILTESLIKTAELNNYKIYCSFVSDKVGLLSESSIYSGIIISPTISTHLLSLNSDEQDICSEDENF
jgi:enoyl reductase-like protein/malonyl CoA-acyl carrier protein transacylase